MAPAAHAAHVKALFIVQVLPIKAILMKTMPNADVVFTVTEGGEEKDVEITLPKKKPVDTNETGDMHVGGFSSYAALAPVVEYIAPSVSNVSPAPVDEYFTPAPAVDAAPAVEFFSPAPVTHAAPAPVMEYIAPAPVVECKAPQHLLPSWSTWHLRQHAAPAPVVEYTAPAPVAQHRATLHFTVDQSASPLCCVSDHCGRETCGGCSQGHVQGCCQWREHNCA